MGSGNSVPPRSDSYLATGSAFNIDIVGYTPKRVRFINQDTGAEAEWTDSMADDSVRTSDSGTDAFATSDGITPRSQGFTVGTNAVINTDTQQIHWTAWA